MVQSEGDIMNYECLASILSVLHWPKVSCKHRKFMGCWYKATKLLLLVTTLTTLSIKVATIIMQVISNKINEYINKQISLRFSFQWQLRDTTNHCMKAVWGRRATEAKSTKAVKDDTREGKGLVYYFVYLFSGWGEGGYDDPYYS